MVTSLLWAVGLERKCPADDDLPCSCAEWAVQQRRLWSEQGQNSGATAQHYGPKQVTGPFRASVSSLWPDHDNWDISHRRVDISEVMQRT